MLTEVEIQENWEKFKSIVSTTFSGDKREAIEKMYEHLEERIVMAPASSIEHYHNAFPGGYVDHVLRVIDLSLQFFEVWERNGAYFNFSKETLIFCAMHHDLGKLGNVEDDFYIPNDSSWHRENQGKIYKYNSHINNMATADRTFYMLQWFGIKYNEVEFLGIKCTDGMYDEDNAKYLKTSDPAQIIKTNIGHILHQADITATRLEYEKWKSLKNGGTTAKSKDDSVVMHKKQNIGKLSDIVSKNGVTDSSVKLFDDLFK